VLGVSAASSSETPHDEEVFVHSSESIVKIVDTAYLVCRLHSI
jgi:hypothetical protein